MRLVRHIDIEPNFATDLSPWISFGRMLDHDRMAYATYVFVKIPWLRWRIDSATDPYRRGDTEEGWFRPCLRLLIPVSTTQAVDRGVWWQPVKTWTYERHGRGRQREASRFILGAE